MLKHDLGNNLGAVTALTPIESFGTQTLNKIGIQNLKFRILKHAGTISNIIGVFSININAIEEHCLSF